MTTQETRGLVGYSNAGLCNMNMSSQLGAISQMWLNTGGVATIVPLKQIKIIWPVSYDSHAGGGSFVIHSCNSAIVTQTNSKGMQYLDLRDLEMAVALGINDTHMFAQGLKDVAVTFILMVHINMDGYTECEVNWELARLVRLKRCLGILPITNSWEWYVTT